MKHQSREVTTALHWTVNIKIFRRAQMTGSNTDHDIAVERCLNGLQLLGQVHVFQGQVHCALQALGASVNLLLGQPFQCLIHVLQSNSKA